MAKKKIVTNEEKYAEWGIDLQELILDVQKQYDSHPKKETYDFLSSLESAQNCIK